MAQTPLDKVCAEPEHAAYVIVRLVDMLGGTAEIPDEELTYPDRTVRSVVTDSGALRIELEPLEPKRKA